MVDPTNRLAAAIEKQNRLLRDQLETGERLVDAIGEVADGLEDRVIQHALEHNSELHTDPDTGRRRQS